MTLTPHAQWAHSGDKRGARVALEKSMVLDLPPLIFQNQEQRNHAP